MEAPIAVKFTVKEVTKRAGKKGPFWSIKDEKGLAYNATVEDFPIVEPGSVIDSAFREQKYTFEGKEITSRWLTHAENKTSAPSATTHSGTERVKIVGGITDGDKTAAVDILKLAVENNLTVSEVVAKYKETLKQLQ